MDRLSGTVALREGWQAIIHRHDRCDVSLFQLGLRLLDHWLNEALRIRVAFCPSCAEAGNRDRAHISVR